MGEDQEGRQDCCMQGTGDKNGFLRLSQRKQESGQGQGLWQRGKCWPGQAWPLRIQTWHTKLGCMAPAQELSPVCPRPTAHSGLLLFSCSFPQNTLFLKSSYTRTVFGEHRLDCRWRLVFSRARKGTVSTPLLYLITHQKKKG